MTTTEIIALQTRIGTLPDGFWGPKSIDACKKHLRRMMPSPHPWPSSDEKSLRKFYGPPGEQHLVNLPVGGLPVYYQGTRCKTIRCHEKVADSLLRVLQSLRGDSAKVMQRYGGCFNLRTMRGGTSLSTHAWGIAIDLDPALNGNKVHWPMQAKMPLDVMEAFSREGWLSAGAFWSRDAMHAQATQ